MPQVPAGDLTGTYYIIVSSLPWQCSWQRLKDFARNLGDGELIDIDHAMVFPGTTDGWVRVKGKENFLKVLAHLNGGIIDHKAITADGRNETNTTNLRDMAPCLPRRHRGSSAARARGAWVDPPIGEYQEYHEYPQTNPSITSYACSEASSDWYFPQHAPSSYSPTSPPSSNISYTHHPSPVYQTAPNPFYIHSPVEYPMAPIASSVVYAGNMAPSTPVYIPQQSLYMVPPPPTEHTYAKHIIASPTPGYQQTPPPIPSVIKTEARKIIITKLPHSTAPYELDELLSNVISKYRTSNGGYYEPIYDIEMAKHVDGTPRGHAFAVFENHNIAKLVVQSLNGMIFQGRALQARLTKEGAEPSKRHAPAISGLISPPSEHCQPLTSSNSNRSVSKPPKHFKDTDRRLLPTIPSSSGSSGRDRSSKPSKDTGSEKKEKLRTKYCEPPRRRPSSLDTPLVVDGSSSRGIDSKAKKYRS